MGTLKIYNTLHRQLENFVPGGEKKEQIEDYPPVTIYSCGPTVYNYAHIGNFRTFVFNDLLRRYLKFKGYTVHHAMNITDVDDKTIAGSQRERMSLKEYTTKYADIFFEDLQSMNIEKVEYYPRATESIDAMEDIIQKLSDQGYTYQKDGSLYFSIKKFDAYGKLSNLDTEEIKSGLRYDTDQYSKEDVRDFVLWKAPKEGEPFWEIPQGKGRPGWHIECSAMIRKIFKTTIDIHTGGVDLIFPHHENEIAQSEAAYNEPFVRYWIHSEHLHLDGEKMSKSQGNIYTIRELLEEGFSARSIRYTLLSAHYRKQLNFSLEGLRSSAQALEKIDNFIIRINDIKKESDHVTPAIETSVNTLLSHFTEHMDNDLNISGAIGVIFEYIRTVNSLLDTGDLSTADAALILQALENVDNVCGFIFFTEDKAASLDAERIEALIEERKKAKADKNYARADEIRDQLLDEGVILEDGKDGTRWKIKK